MKRFSFTPQFKSIYRYFSLLLLSFLLLFGTADAISHDKTPPGSTEGLTLKSLREKIDEILDDPQLEHAFTGIKIVSLNDGKVIYQKNADKLFHPASNTKLLTTAAAISKLGNFKFKTVISANGHIDNDVLKGNLFVRGCGDGIFSLDNMDSIVAMIYVKGIRTITGNLVGNVSYFDTVSWGPGWMWDDEPESDEPFITPLSVNGNSVKIAVRRTSGAKPDVEITPMLPSFSITNNCIIGSDASLLPLNVVRPHGENRFIVTGEYTSRDSSRDFDLSVSNPAMFYLELLKSKLNDQGIVVNGKLLIDSMKGKTALAEIDHPLDSILVHINKNSENLAAENLLKTMAAEVYGAPGTWNNGVLAVKDYLASAGVDTAAIILADGSGVSFYNAISPNDFIKVLADQYHRKKTFERFFATLPIAGIDGTLHARMKNTVAEGRVHAKTGTLTGVSSLSGYVTTIEGKILAFSVLNNHFPGESHYIRDAQDEIMKILVRLK
jgi:D-alanyl-D-alanine carboxypeptidase/D-alanyl-D-alanine-endopeptidase (penicillin-binding protein 4)